MMLVRLRILAAILCRSLLLCLLYNVSPASGSMRTPIASTNAVPSEKPKKQQLSKPKKQQLLRIHGSANQSVPGGRRCSWSKSGSATAPAGNGKAPALYLLQNQCTHSVSTALATSRSHHVSRSSVRICRASQEAERCDVGHDA
jgi:hypothetical protein